MLSMNMIGLLLIGLLFIGIESRLIDYKCSKSCSTGGFCLKLNEEGKCYCLPEWEGEMCDIPSEKPETYEFLKKNQMRNSVRSVPCDYVPDLCQGRGICIFNETAKKVGCVCQYPYAGARCEEISVCYEYCFNDKVCKVIEGEAKCDCGADFSGSRCQTAITTTTTPPPPTTTNIICSYLPEDYCKNQGSCIVNNGKAACQCPPTHYGTYCETPVGGTPGPGTTLRPVTPGPGTIGPGITNSPGNLVVGSCSTNPCLNNRPCYESGNSYYCFCGSSYTGTNCQTVVG